MKCNRMFFIFGGLIVLILVVLFEFNFINNDGNDLFEINIDDYKYKLIYDFGGIEYDIYLLDDYNIKIIERSSIFDKCEETNCIISSNDYEYKGYSLNFNNKASQEIVKFIKDLFKNYDTKELIIDDITLTLDEVRYLNSIVFNNDDLVTLNDDIKFKTIVKEFKNDYNDVIISNNATLLKGSIDNKVVNKIRDYLNDIVREDFNNLNNDINSNFDFYKGNHSKEILGVNFTLKMEWLGTYRISFRYITEGSIGGVGWYVDKGYIFNVNNGEVISEIPNGYKEELYEVAVNNFMQQSIYLNEKEQLVDNWRDILYDEMFNVGNWYETKDNVVFLIESYKLGFDEATSKIININVENQYGEI